jgi:hypothetical protein
MVGILGAAEVLRKEVWNCGGNCGVGGPLSSSVDDCLDAEDFLEGEDSNLVRLFFFFNGFAAALGSPFGMADGTSSPPCSMTMAWLCPRGMCG